MKLPFLAVAVCLVAFVALQPSRAQNAFTPEQVKWGPAPPFVPAGAKIAVLERRPDCRDRRLHHSSQDARTGTRSLHTRIRTGRT